MPERLPRWLLAAGLTLVVGSAVAAVAAPTAFSRNKTPDSGVLFLETRVVSAPRLPGAPTHVDIPAIGVSSDVGPLGLRPDGTVQVPTNGPRVGWYEGSAAPGARGSSVLLGHTSRTGHAVFNRLRELRPGDVVQVDRADAAIARFVVDRVAVYAKNGFPTREVYGPSSKPVLRLVTCAGLKGGRFTRNLVVFAHLEGSS